MLLYRGGLGGGVTVTRLGVMGMVWGSWGPVWGCRDRHRGDWGQFWGL